MSTSVDEYQRQAAKLPPATVSIEKQGRKWVFTVACNDCGLVVGRYPDWFEHALDCPQGKDGT